MSNTDKELRVNIKHPLSIYVCILYEFEYIQQKDS